MMLEYIRYLSTMIVIVILVVNVIKAIKNLCKKEISCWCGKQCAHCTLVNRYYSSCKSTK